MLIEKENTSDTFSKNPSIRKKMNKKKTEKMNQSDTY